MIREILYNEIQEAVKNIFGKDFDFSVKIDGIHADYSSNIVMIMGGNPRENAKKIKEEILQSQNFIKYFSKIEIAGLGFLNFWLSKKGLEEGLKFIQKDKFDFGKNKKTQVEFISVNPTGEMHIGHGRSAFYGDALSNILKTAGYDVQREFYINDAKKSTQIKELGKTVLGKGISYFTKYLSSKIKAQSAKLRKIKNEGEVGYFLAREIQKDNKKFIEKDLDIKFDKWFSEEKDLYKKSMVKKTIDLLKRKNLIYEKDGAIWMKTSQHGDDEDRVITRSDGVPAYFLTDIAYHIDKFIRGFKTIIDVWGADHQGHEKRMYAAKKALGWKGDLKILITQLVMLKEGGEKKKFSKRKGDVILLKDLLKEVGIDAMRWFFLEKTLSTHMEFDMTLAKERSKKNPVYYVQYAHARACSIIKKSKVSAKGAVPAGRQGSASGGKIQNSKERNLILKLIQFPEIIEDIAKDYQVQRLTTYAYELAKVFTNFYENVPVLKAETEELKKSRLALVFAAKNILERSLSLMGISVPERM